MCLDIFKHGIIHFLDKDLVVTYPPADKSSNGSKWNNDDFIKFTRQISQTTHLFTKSSSKTVAKGLTQNYEIEVIEDAKKPKFCQFSDPDSNHNPTFKSKFKSLIWSFSFVLVSVSVPVCFSFSAVLITDYYWENKVSKSTSIRSE